MRTTKSQVESAFKALTAACGKRVATKYNDVGAWDLDHNSVYGGYVIEEVISDSGAVTRPFGDRRRKAEEFYNACWFAVEAIRIKEGQ